MKNGTSTGGGAEAPLIRELKRLRQRSGLTQGVRGFIACPNLMASLGAANGDDAKERLGAQIRDVGEGLDPLLPLALATAYGLWFHPKTKYPIMRGQLRDYGNLGNRRDELRELSGYKDVGAIEDAENAMIAELHARLSPRTTSVKDAPYSVTVVYSIIKRRQHLVNVNREVDGETIETRSLVYKPDTFSADCVVYKLPPNWYPDMLYIYVQFFSPPYPIRFRSSASNTLSQLTSMSGRCADVKSGVDVDDEDGSVTPYIWQAFSVSDPNDYFGIFWESGLHVHLREGTWIRLGRHRSQNKRSSVSRNPS